MYQLKQGDTPAGGVKASGSCQLVGSVSLTGVREDNQDTVLAMPLAANRWGAFWGGLVADGAGGTQGGALASQTAAWVFEEFLKRLPHLKAPLFDGEPSKDSILLLGEMIAAAVDIELTALRNSDRALRYMATTFTGVVAFESARGPRLLMIHLGDSRAYLMTGGELLQLSRDHSKAALLAETGEKSDHWNVLWGSFPGNHVNRYLQVEVLQVPTDSRLILCSDGAWGSLHRGAMESVLMGTQDPQAAAETMATRALDRSDDNVSIVVWQMETAPDTEDIHEKTTIDRKEMRR